MADIILNANWDGDYSPLDYIQGTIENTSTLISGVTVDPNITVDVNGTSAYYFKNGKPKVTNGTSGRELIRNQSGNERKVIVMNESLQINEDVPDVVAENLSVDIVNEKTLDGATTLTNTHSVFGTDEALQGGTETTVLPDTPLTKATVYDTVVDMRTEFNLLEPERINANYLKVSEKTYGLLLKVPEFTNLNLNGLLENGVIGRIAGLDVVLDKALETTSTWADIVFDFDRYDMAVGSWDAFGAPTNLNSFRTIDSSTSFGSLIQAEVSYGFSDIDPTRFLYHTNAA